VALGLKYDSIEAYLKSYGKYIVKQARKILDQKDKNTTGKLRKSLRYKVIENENGFDIKFYASKYAAFVNKGVSGTQTTRTYIDKDGKRKRSPFKYKSGLGNAPNITAIQSWINKRNIKARDELGRFIKSKSLAYLISKSIQKKGIPAASFYTQPLSYSFNLFQKELVKNFKTDILNEIKTFKK
tara:strand:- start:544 stop:1095 length:552 start_codon:yes stop_codon:yes gene_type:complete